MLAGQQETDTTRNAAIFAIGIKADGSDWNGINTSVTISPGDSGWGNAWATHFLDVYANTLWDEGVRWLRPLFRLDSQGVYQIQCIEIRDITAEYNAAGSANAAAGSASTASIKANEAGNSASAANTSQTNAATNDQNSWNNRLAAAGHESAAWDHRVGAAAHESQAQTYRNEASTSASSAAGSSATASQQAGLASNSANSAGQSAGAAAGSAQTASSKASEAQQSAQAASSSQVTASNAAKDAASRATGNIVSRGEWDAGSGKGQWDGSTNVGFANDIGQHVLSQSDRDSYDGQPIAGNWSNRRFRVSGEVQTWGNYHANVGIHCVTNSGQNQWYIQRAANAGLWYTPFNFELLLSGNVKAARAVLVSDGDWGVGTHGLNWRSIRIEDITSEKAAADSASAASGSYSSALYEATQALQRAEAASGHANTAAIRAGDAQSSANSAAGSAATADQRAAAAASSATLAATFSTGGGNVLPETTFASGTIGWNQYSPSGATNLVWERDLAGDQWRAIGEHVIGIRQADTNTGRWAQWHSDQVSVTGNTWYEFSAISGAHRCHAYIRVDWVDANGNGISSNYSNPNNSERPGGNNLNEWFRHWGKAQSPWNAARAHFVMVKDPTLAGYGYDDSYAWFGRPMLRQTYEQANGPSPYAPGSGALTQTAMSASITTNQQAIATANSSLANLTQTVAANGAAITTTAQALSTTDGKVNTALARAGVRLDVNGYVSGWEMANNGQTGNMVINADHFAIQRPGGGPRTEYSSGRWMSTDGGSWMTVWGAPFGSGNRFMRWSGPYFGDLNQCNEGNAKEYLRVDGSMYFGGALLAGTLRNSSASSSLAANASTTTGEFGSNGGTITVNASWVYQYQVTGTYPATLQGRNDYDAAVNAFGAAASSDGGHSHQGSKADGLNGSQIVLNLRKGGGLVASQASGTRITSLEGNRPTIGDSGGSIVWTYSHSSSFTHTDDQHAAANRVFSVDVSRNLGSGSNVSQRVSVTTVE